MSSNAVLDFKNSITDRKAFLTELSSEIAAIRKNAKSMSPDQVVQALVNLASRKGYDLSPAEVKDALSDEELNDEDLELVSGGSDCGFCSTCGLR